MIRLRLTPLQREELLHKLEILREEPELLEAYRVTEDELGRLAARTAAGELLLSEPERALLVSEAENLLQIALDNVELLDGAERRETAGYIRSMRNLKTKLENSQDGVV